ASEERLRAEPRRGEAGAALHLEIVLRQGTPLPAARAAVILKHLADLGRVAEVSPPPAAMAAGGFDGRFRLTLETRAGPARVRAIVLDLPAVSECHAGPVRENRTRRDRRRSAGRRSPAEAASPESDAPASAASAAEVVPARPDTIGTVRVSTERMDRLLDGIGELILDRERLKRALDARPADREQGMRENLGR